MNPRERMLTIRLLKKAAEHPVYIKSLGIEYDGDRERNFVSDFTSNSSEQIVRRAVVSH